MSCIAGMYGLALADGRSVGAASTVQRNIIYILPYSVFHFSGKARIPYSRFAETPVFHVFRIPEKSRWNTVRASLLLMGLPRAAKEVKVSLT